MPEDVSSVAAESTATIRPATFEEAFARAEESSSQADRESAPPASSASVSEGPPAATVPTTEPAQESASKKGPIPFEVHDKALANARTKTRAEVDTEYRQRYGWAEGIAPDIGTQLIQMAQRAAADPLAFALSNVEEMLAHPTHGRYMRSALGRYLASDRTNGHVGDDDEPPPDLRIPGADGQEYFTYTDGQLRKREAWLQRQWEAKIDGRLKPIEEDRQQQVITKHAETIQAKATSEADAFLERIGLIPQFTEHFNDLRETMQAHPDMSEWQAAFEVLRTKILPTLGRTEQTKLLTNLHQTAVAATVNPSQPSTAPVKRFAKPSVAAFAEALGMAEE